MEKIHLTVTLTVAESAKEQDALVDRRVVVAHAEAGSQVAMMATAGAFIVAENIPHI